MLRAVFFPFSSLSREIELSSIRCYCCAGIVALTMPKHTPVIRVPRNGYKHEDLFMFCPMTAPVRIQLSRAKGWRLPPNTMKVDRSTRYGNMARVVYDEMRWCGNYDEEGEPILQGPWACLISRKDSPTPAGWWFGTREEAQAKAVEYFRFMATTVLDVSAELRAIIPNLRDSNVACWCGLDEPCHGDVLLELANS